MNKPRFSILLLLAFLGGCGSYHTGLYGTRPPGFSNDYPASGIITGAGPFVYKDSLIPKMQELCESMGGLNYSSIQQIPAPKGVMNFGDINPYYESLLSG